MPKYSPDSDNEVTAHSSKLFGRQRPIHAVLGGGRIADVLLWRDRKVSAALSIGLIVLWFLFEVVEYNFVTLFCHISIAAMLPVFIWFSGAQIFNWNVPDIPHSILDESTVQHVAMSFYAGFRGTLTRLIDIACGKDPAIFFLIIICLYILSIIGNYFTFLNFLYLGFLCLMTLPLLYERYENEAEDYAGILIRQVRKTYRRFNSNVLNKIPRGKVKEKKSR